MKAALYAVLIPWLKTEYGDALLLEVRSDKVKQPGEICFPGGRIEAGETAEMAAVRETCEELGVQASEIVIIGEHDSLIMGDGREIHIVEAVLNVDSISTLNLSEDEVAEVFLLPAEWLAAHEITHYVLSDTSDDDLPNKLRSYLSHYGDYRYKGETDYIEYDSHGIWGLTARIIVKIQESIKRKDNRETHVQSNHS